MRPYCLLFFLWVAPVVLSGNPGGAAYEALEQADFCIASEDYAAARALYLEALPYFVARKDYRRQSYIYLWLSETAYYLGETARALEEAQYSCLLAESRLSPDTLPFYCTILQNLGLFHSGLGDFDAQMKYYLRALDAALQYHGQYGERTADAYLSVGAAYGRRGRWRECINYTDTSMQIAQKAGYRGGVASALLNLSYSFAEQEDFDKAIQYQKQALAAANRTEERARGLNNLGSLYNDIGENGNALSVLHQALQLRRVLYLPSDHNVFSTLLNIAQAHSESGQPDSAGHYLNEAIGGLLQSGNAPDRALLQIAYNHKGKLSLQEGGYAAAEQALRQALALNGNRKDINSSSLMLLGETLLAQGRYQEALAAAQEGLRWAAPGFDSPAPADNPPWESLESVSQGRGLLKLKGDILRSEGLARGRPALLKASLATFSQADSLVMWSRKTFQSRASRDLLAARANELYAGALRTLYHLYRQSGDSLYFNRALAFSEKSKALSVLENLNGLYARSFSGAPDAVVEAERRLLEEVEFYSNLIRQYRDEESASQLSAWEALLFEKRRQQDSLLDRIKTEYPRYYQMKHDFQMASAQPLREELLAEGETLLEYFWAEDSVFVFLLSEKQRQFFCLPARGLREKVLALRRSAVLRDTGFFELSHGIYRALFQPLEPFIQGEKLAIVPDNVLAYLPFELLLYGPAPPGGSPHSQHAYLIRKYSIRYFFSANTALQAKRNKAAAAAHPRVLALAPDFGAGGGARFAGLPGARSEVDSLEEGFRGLFLKGRQASEANFRKYCGRFGAYHIATHADINERVPTATHLLLAGGGGQDGQLHVFELYNMQLEAELAVLSACNTGVGQFKVGEGAASLAHAFAYAGCPNMAMSLWPVKDRTTPVLIRRFYDNMAAGMDKCEALRQAKLYYLEYDELFAHPYYWSGFIYVGGREPLALEQRGGFPLWPLLLLLAFTGAGLAIALRRRGRR